MNRTRSTVAATAAAAALAPAALAQTPPKYASPEAALDGRVTVRLYAPNARTVAVSGSWDGWKSHELTRGDDGVWSATVGPWPADIYEYHFNVDGQATLDPKNPELRPFDNRVEVARGATDLYWQPQPGPRGSLHALHYASRVVGGNRRIHVYTPPGYEESGRKRYPVLFLLHGSGDTDDTWSSGLGRANVILDNLINGKKAVPMIVVMPEGHIRAPGKTLPPTAFEDDLIGDVLPLVDRQFRTLARPESRAICGLSMGGGQTVTVGMKHPELFGAFGVFSAGVWNNAGPAFDTAISNLAKSRSGKPGPLIWVAIGKDDFLYEACKTLKERLTAAGLPFTYVETEGGHIWPNWRAYLNRFAPLVFAPRE